MVNLAPEPGEFRFTIEVTRKETGLVETHEMIGHSDPEKLKEIMEKRRAAALAENQSKE